MSDERREPDRRGFWESRTDWSLLKKALFLEPVIGGSRWWAAFGSLLLFVFLLQVISGVLLTTCYSPSTDSAWKSVKYMQDEVPLGWLIRAVHNWGASAMVILLLVHLLQVFTWGAYKRPRELTWMVGVLLLFCTLGLAFTGYLLPWDQQSYWATKVGLDIVGTVPLIGPPLHQVMQGGPELGNLTLTRFFSIHAFMLPGLLTALVVAHLYLFRVHGVTPAWWESAAQSEREAEPFWPGQVFKDGVVALVFLVGLGVWCWFFPAPLGPESNPAQPYDARPDWYFMFFFQLLRYFPRPYEVVGTVVLPVAFFLILLLWPLLDRNPRRDPRRRPVAMSLLGTATIGLIGLTVYSIAVHMRPPPAAAPLASAAAPAPKAAGPFQQMNVAALYKKQCVSCHGQDGSGSPVRSSLPEIPNFTSLGWQTSHTDLEIAQQIERGSPSSMPAFKDKLTHDQILALAVFVRSFAVISQNVANKSSKTPEAAQTPVASGQAPQKLYGALCQGCHGANGHGDAVRKAMPAIPDFADSQWQKTHQEAELEKSILDGRGKFMLPMKGVLPPSDAKQLVSLVRSFANPKPAAGTGPKKPAESVGTPAANSAADKLAARMQTATRLYHHDCIACHGPKGTGKSMRDSMPSLPDFTDRSWQQKTSDAELDDAIWNGKGDIMPAWKDKFTRQETQDLAAYVRAFAPAATPSAASTPLTRYEKAFQDLKQHDSEFVKQLQKTSPPAGQPKD